MNDASMIVIKEQPRAVVELLERAAEAAAQAEENYFTPLDEDHSAVFLRGSETLFVSFELAEASVGTEGRLFAQDVHEAFGWSCLSVIAARRTWFRAEPVFAFIDHLVDAEYFDDYERVIFYGEGCGGYAACAYSVAAPGAHVLAVAPQATLDPLYAGWDKRFAFARRLSFEDRYGYAPHMTEAASSVDLLFDPYESEDASHAAQFNQRHVRHHRLRYYGKAPANLLAHTGELMVLLEALAQGPLTDQRFAEIHRRRRANTSYIRKLLTHATVRDRPVLSALICRNVTQRFENPGKFARRLRQLEGELADAGLSLPECRTAPAE